LADWVEEFMGFSGKKFSKRLYLCLCLGKCEWKYQSKRLCNPEKNGWKVPNTDAIISSNGLLACYNTGEWHNVFSKKGFPISGELCRKDNFPGTILYYFEVTQISSYRWVKLSKEQQIYLRPRARRLTIQITINVSNSGIFSLASHVEISQMALKLVTYQIHMLLKPTMIIAGSPGRNMTLNGQKAPLNLSGMAQGMCMVAACCWILEMDCPFSSLQMEF
jgi:hypothetical protein